MILHVQGRRLQNSNPRGSFAKRAAIEQGSPPGPCAGAAELGDAPGDALLLAGAAAVLDQARGMEAIAVPGAGRDIGKAAASAVDIAHDVEEAPTNTCMVKLKAASRFW